MTVDIPRETPGDSTWFTADRFGMFIHWGLYSMTARDYGPQRHEKVATEDYEARYFTRFDPDLFDPEAWADAAVKAGMKYVVVVAKHHEGFCLWDSALTDFKATNSPAGRDLLREILDAFRRRGLRTGVYYSLLDWHHPDFTVDNLHPLIGPDIAPLNATRDMARYREYVRGQVTELLTQYGPLDYFWPDYSYDVNQWKRNASSPEALDSFVSALKAMFGPSFDLDSHNGKGAADWEAEDLLALIRRLQPDILINDRLGLDEGWDVTTPEQRVPREWPRVKGELALWETCHTMSGAWGHQRGSTWKSTEQLIGIMTDVVSKGGNLLLNVGPTGRGEFGPEADQRLEEIGVWMRQHGRSIYGCTRAPQELLDALPENTRATYNPTTNRLYVHMLAWPAESLIFPGLAPKVDYAQLLHDASELQRPSLPMHILRGPSSEDLWLDIPVERPDVAIPVIELYLTARA